MENHTIANLACSLLKYFGAEGTGNATLPEADVLLQKKYKNVVVLLLDGMGTEILRKHLEPEGWFRRHLAAEYHSVFPPTTVAATTSIDSGLFPNQHGWLGWTCYYKEIDKNVTVFSNTDEEDLPAADFPVASTYYPYIKVTERIREAGKEAYVVSPFGELAVSSFAELCEEVGRLCETGGEKYIYAYWMEPDGLMHKAGVDAPEVTQLLRELEKQAANLAAGLEDTLFLVTADHGHINAGGVSLTEFPHIMECLCRMPSIEPRALNLFVKDDMHAQFVKAFNEAFGETFRLYTKKEVLEKRIFGTGEDHVRFADLLGDYLAVAVSDLAIYNTVEEKEMFIGVHAGMTEEELRIPLIAFGKEKRLKELDWHNYEEGWPVLQRYAVRGIIRDEKGRYALVQSKKYGECKFPGGGMEDGETREETLIREVEEETGMQVRPDSIRYFGETLERKRGYREEQTIFEQHSYYYFCQVDTDHMGSQHLTEDEEELGYTLVWLSMEEALEQMRKAEARVQDWLWHIPWLKRDTCVMEMLLGDR